MLNIVIDGNIGSGKSTVLDMLSKNKEFNIVQENLNDWKPYLTQFYEDMKGKSLSFQMKVLLHHMTIYEHIKNNKITNILERSPLSCIHIFGKSLEESGMLSKLDLQLMIDYNKKFGWYPEYLIYINTDPDICLKRIKQRDRKGETISLDYLKNIDTLYTINYQNYSILEEKGVYTKVITIDGNRSKEEVYKDVLDTIKKLVEWETPYLER